MSLSWSLICILDPVSYSIVMFQVKFDTACVTTIGSCSNQYLLSHIYSITQTIPLIWAITGCRHLQYKYSLNTKNACVSLYSSLRVCLNGPPPSGLSGVLFCRACGFAGLPLTSARLILFCGGPLETGLSPLSHLSSELALSWRPGLSDPPLSEPPRCSIPLNTSRGAPSTVCEARGKAQEHALVIYKKHYSTKSLLHN